MGLALVEQEINTRSELRIRKAKYTHSEGLTELNIEMPRFTTVVTFSLRTDTCLNSLKTFNTYSLISLVVLSDAKIVDVICSLGFSKASDKYTGLFPPRAAGQILSTKSAVNFFYKMSEFTGSIFCCSNL